MVGAIDILKLKGRSKNFAALSVTEDKIFLHKAGSQENSFSLSYMELSLEEANFLASRLLATVRLLNDRKKENHQS